MAERFKVLIVDDASFMRRALIEILESDPAIEVVASACNGLEGFEKIKEVLPDVVTLDIDMPIMDGLAAIRHIMIETPVPIVVISSMTHDGAITFEALRLGVVDFIPKPSGAVSLDMEAERQRIIDRVKVARTVNINNVRRVRLVERSAEREVAAGSAGNGRPEFVIVVGTNLSGPNTIIRLMSKLSPTLPASVVVIQEISPRIINSFVERFDQCVPWNVRVAQTGMVLERGTCYVGSNEHGLRVALGGEGKPCLDLGDGAEEPISSLFTTAAGVFRQQTVGVLLTGIGEDGADGLARIRATKGTTIAQDGRCCVFPNLAENAIQRGVVDLVVRERYLYKAVETVIGERTGLS
ncbi:MAG TPA: chemotaxis protein CheB [Syntrophobacteria bacterium]|nr:chemotaxis protein CheB [Syntrophobacteria bacterium]